MARALSWVRREAGELVAALRARGVVLASILALVVLYVVGLVVPQAGLVERPAWEAWREARPRLVGALEWSGLADVYRSPLMYVATALFFASLVAVLWERVPRLLRRTRLDQGLPLDPDVLARRKGTVELPAPDGAAAVDRAAAFLAVRRYQAFRPEPGRLRAVKYRLAPAGFLLFHGSFALVLAGALALDLTRFAANATVAEGESFDVSRSQLDGRPRFPRKGAGYPPVAFTVVDLRPQREGATPVRLEADLLLAGEVRPRTAEVNHPIRVGSTSILVTGVGPTPLLTCETADGASDGAYLKLLPGEEVTHARLEGCGLEILARPVVAAKAATGRTVAMVGDAAAGAATAELPEGLEVALRTRDGSVTRGVLHPGSSLTTSDGTRRLAMPELRLSGRFQIVDERGGTLLWMSFVLGIVGLVARLVLYRRELAVVHDPAAGRLLVAAASDVPGAGGQADTIAALRAALHPGTS